MIYKAKNIKWETDGQAVELPDSTEIEAEDIDQVADKLSDKYGFLINSLDVEV